MTKVGQAGANRKSFGPEVQAELSTVNHMLF
jgi:hypothetical protein